jgi:hypothetical protein
MNIYLILEDEKKISCYFPEVILWVEHDMVETMRILQRLRIQNSQE